MHAALHDPLEKAQQKIRVWKREVDHSSPPVALHHGVDLSLHPSEPRGNFPGLTPFRVLTASDVVSGPDKIVYLPSVRGTALVSACVGAAITLLMCGNPSAPLARLLGRCRAAGTVEAAAGGPPTATRVLGASLRTVLRLLRLAMVATVGVWYARFLKGRQAAVRSLSRYSDVSGTPDRGPCIIADRVLTITNSHAGTHADMPAHFVIQASPRDRAERAPSPTANAVGGGRVYATAAFDDAHYSGDALILDVSEELARFSPDTNAISVEVIEAALAKLPAEFKNGSRHVWRLVFVTRRLRQFPKGAEAEWDQGLAYFVPAAVELLCKRLPLLVLAGTDSASVDHPTVSPICEASHGAFLSNGIALLENLRCEDLYPRLTDPSNACKGVLEGALLTVFNPTQSFEDSRGCSVIFFPHTKACP